MDIKVKTNYWNLKRQVRVRLGSFFFLPTIMLSGWNKTGEMAIRRCLCSATNEIWVIGESNFPSVAQNFSLLSWNM